MLWSIRKHFRSTIKNYIKIYENIGAITTAQGDDCTTGCLLEYSYFIKNYKMIGIDLSKQQVFDAYRKAM